MYTKQQQTKHILVAIFVQDYHYLYQYQQFWYSRPSTCHACGRATRPFTVSVCDARFSSGTEFCRQRTLCHVELLCWHFSVNLGGSERSAMWICRVTLLAVNLGGSDLSAMWNCRVALFLGV